VRRVYIPKADGRPKTARSPALEDKIVQRAAVEVLKLSTKLTFSIFRTGSGPRAAASISAGRALAGLLTKKVNGLLDLDIKAFSMTFPRMAM